MLPTDRPHGQDHPRLQGPLRLHTPSYTLSVRRQDGYGCVLQQE